MSKKLRFTVLTRDNFTCRYCGVTSATAILEIDHLIPVSKGGRNTFDNLVTSCFSCNRGKSATTLGCKPPEDLKMRRASIKDQEEVSPATLQLITTQKRKKQWLIDYWCYERKTKSMEATTLGYLLRQVNEYGMDAVLHCIDKAVPKFPAHAPDEAIGRYISGMLKRLRQFGETPTKHVSPFH